MRTLDIFSIPTTMFSLASKYGLQLKKEISKEMIKYFFKKCRPMYHSQFVRDAKNF